MKKTAQYAELYKGIKSGYEVSTSGPSRMNYQTTMCVSIGRSKIDTFDRISVNTSLSEGI